VKQIVTLVLLGLGGFVAWRIGESLSSDAISMGLGIFFGMVAGIPASILVLAASRRRDYLEDVPQARRMNEGAGSYTNQPPVIVLAGMGGLPQQAGMSAHGASGANGAMSPWLLPNNAQNMMEESAWSRPRPAREYRIVGERDEVIEEW